MTAQLTLAAWITSSAHFLSHPAKWEYSTTGSTPPAGDRARSARKNSREADSC